MWYPTTATEATLTALIFLAALLYSSVGHGGASGYLAAMTLFGLPAEQARRSVLILNLLVSGLGTYRFHRSRAISWRLLLPFLPLAIPLSFVGAGIKISPLWHGPLLAAVLLWSAWRITSATTATPAEPLSPPKLSVAVVAGGVIGLIAGMTGTGGGIFLSPLILFCRWGQLRDAAAVAAPFIFLNSLAGYCGQWARPIALSPQFPLWCVAALAGGAIGSRWAAHGRSPQNMRYFLSLVLGISALKLILVTWDSCSR